MSLTWFRRKSRLQTVLESNGDEEKEALALDALLHGQTVIGKTPKTTEVDKLRFGDNDIDVVGPLAHGQFGTVELVNCRLDGRVYVRKRIDKHAAIKARDQCSPQIERDILLLALKSKSLWVPHILCAFQNVTHLSIVMQYAEGGSLWDVIESSPNDGRLPQGDLKWWLPQCVSAIAWCHQQGFVHRDIKPHNFVLSKSSHLLLIDFGSAAPLLPRRSDGAQLVPNRHCLVPCGTCDYISPEILKAHEEALVALEMKEESNGDAGSLLRDHGSANLDEGGYGRETDWWSLGAMIYEMAYGIAPFFANDIRQTYLRIMQHERSLRFDSDAAVSADLVALLRGMLCNAEFRVGRHAIEEVTEHPFFQHVDWRRLHDLPAPSNLHLPQFTYSSPVAAARQQDHHTPSDYSSPKPFAFSALFQSSRWSSPGLSILHTASGQKSQSSSEHAAIASFIGFSWGPPLDTFEQNASDQSFPFPETANHAYTTRIISQPVHSATPRVAAANYYTTPIRPTPSTLEPGTVLTGTLRRTGPRRAVSDREAMKQLVDCVGMSARKRVLESGRKPRILSGTLSRRGSGGGSGTLRELRFGPAPRVPDLVIDNASTASSDTELLPSPSPSPRPGSAMSMMSRSGTPTVTMSSRSLPLLQAAANSERVALASTSGETGVSMTLPDAVFSDLEKRYAKLMGDIDGVEKRLGAISLQISRGDRHIK